MFYSTSSTSSQRANSDFASSSSSCPIYSSSASAFAQPEPLAQSSSSSNSSLSNRAAPNSPTANKHFQDLPKALLQNNLLPLMSYSDILQLRQTSKTYYKDIEALFSALLEIYIARSPKALQEEARRELYCNNNARKGYSATAKMLRYMQQQEMTPDTRPSPLSFLTTTNPSQLMQIRSSWDPSTQKEIFQKQGKRSIEYFSSRLRTMRWLRQRCSILTLNQTENPLLAAACNRWPELLNVLYNKAEEMFRNLPENDPRRKVFKDSQSLLPTEKNLPELYVACKKIQMKANAFLESSEKATGQRIQQAQDKAKMAKQLEALKKADRLQEIYLLRSCLQSFQPPEDELHQRFLEALPLPTQDLDRALIALTQWLYTRIGQHPSFQTFFKSFNTTLDGLTDIERSSDYISAVGRALITSWGLPYPPFFPAVNHVEILQQILQELSSQATATAIWTLAPLLLERMQEGKLELVAPGVAKFLTLLSHIKYTKDDKYWDQIHGQELPFWRDILPRSFFNNALFPVFLKILDIPCNDRALLESLEKNCSPNIDDLSQIHRFLLEHFASPAAQLSLAMRSFGQLMFGLSPTVITRLEQAKILKEFPALVKLLKSFQDLPGTEQLQPLDNEETHKTWEAALPSELFQNKKFLQLLAIFEKFLQDPEISKIIEKIGNSKLYELNGTMGKVRNRLRWGSIASALQNRISSLSFDFAHSNDLMELLKFFKLDIFVKYFKDTKTRTSQSNFNANTFFYLAQAYQRVPPVNNHALLLRCTPWESPLLSWPFARMPSSFWQQIRIIDLSGQTILHHLPLDICRATNLETLTLDGCTNLETLPRGLAKLRLLKNVSVKKCTKLKKENLPEEFDASEALHELWARKSTIACVDYTLRKYRGEIFVAVCSLLGTISGIALRRFCF